MQPQAQPATQGDGFRPKYKHFHPQSTVWVKNPLKHDVVFQVADEYNRPFEYLIKKNSTAELPGGAVATLGVKAIVDELIQNNPKDALLLHEPKTREKYEAEIIVNIKEKPVRGRTGPEGQIDLSVPDEAADEAESVSNKPEEEFPDLEQDEPTTAPELPPADTRVGQGIASIAGASLPGQNAIIED
jgi:hypothetical protein